MSSTSLLRARLGPGSGPLPPLVPAGTGSRGRALPRGPSQWVPLAAAARPHAAGRREGACVPPARPRPSLTLGRLRDFSNGAEDSTEAAAQPGPMPSHMLSLTRHDVPLEAPSTATRPYGIFREPIPTWGIREACGEAICWRWRQASPSHGAKWEPIRALTDPGRLAAHLRPCAAHMRTLAAAHG